MQRIWILSIMLLFLTSCGDDIPQQYAIEKHYTLDRLHDERYLFPAKPESTAPIRYLPLERFDIIFAGHDYNSSSAEFAYATPGRFTHALLYLGKDAEGFAYGVEINTDGNEEYRFDASGMHIDGHLYIYCLGSDYGERACKEDLYIHGLETYDFLDARRLIPALRTTLMRQRERIMETIHTDLKRRYPAQLPFHIGAETVLTKTIPLIDDGRADGADCTSYITSLFEEVGGICLEEFKMDAAEIEAYYRDDPAGQKAILLAQYNPFSNEAIPFSELLGSGGFRLVDPLSPQNGCDSKTGVPVPDKLYHSPSLQAITPL